MKTLLTILAIVSITACVSSSTTKVTHPDGTVLCSKDPDCFEGQYCGFISGYTGAVCKGQPTSLFKNLQ